MPDDSILLNKLICGEEINHAKELSFVLNNLSKRIEYLTNNILETDFSNNNFCYNLPFWARSLLETVSTAILSRLDPFRVVSVYKVQNDSSFDLGKKTQSAIQWNGDIIGVKPQPNIWCSELSKDKFDQALLSKHRSEIIWIPSNEALIDYIDEKDLHSEWLDEIRSEDNNYKKFLSISQRLFSSFSKGVHSETLVDLNLTLDKDTIISLIMDLFKFSSYIGITSHFSGYIIGALTEEKALEYFLNVEEMSKNVGKQ